MGKNKRKSTAIQLISRMCLKSWKGREKKRKKQKEGEKCYRKCVYFPLLGFEKRKESSRIFVCPCSDLKEKRGKKNPGEQRK